MPHLDAGPSLGLATPRVESGIAFHAKKIAIAVKLLHYHVERWDEAAEIG